MTLSKIVGGIIIVAAGCGTAWGSSGTSGSARPAPAAPQVGIGKPIPQRGFDSFGDHHFRGDKPAP